MKKQLRTLFLLLMAYFILYNTGQASAYCIYNFLNESADFHGEHCDRCFHGTIGAGQKKCCPGDESGCRGDTWISMTITIGGSTFALRVTREYTCAAPVDAHGWVEISKRNNTFWCVVYRQNGSVKANAGMTTP